MSITEEVFHTAIATNRWGSSESVSGSGSTLKATKLIREALPGALKRFRVTRLVDAACGDCNWISHLDYEFDLFIGCDVVPTLVSKLRSQAFSGQRRFQVADVSSDILPNADAVLCRDCLVHLPFAMIHRALQNFQTAGFTYALLTTFPGRTNEDIPVGRWRPLDMQAEPFNLPRPLLLLRERPENPEDKYNDKMLGVWDVRKWAKEPMLPPLSEPRRSPESQRLEGLKEGFARATTVDDLKRLLGDLVDALKAR